MGRTGAGKHSMVAAILRLFEPNGVIRIDGVDTGTLSLKVHFIYILSLLSLSGADSYVCPRPVVQEWPSSIHGYSALS